MDFLLVWIRTILASYRFGLQPFMLPFRLDSQTVSVPWTLQLSLPVHRPHTNCVTSVQPLVVGGADHRGHLVTQIDFVIHADVGLELSAGVVMQP